ncbi:MAG: SDR family NAD(P)-dependent oxidoreductase [Cytophagales bacterium]|nr:SDR family NAD(P)-dependent oxidoreductase [Cytophagales bacterium]
MQITIVGAGSGISRSVAALFGSKGYRVGLIARSEEKLRAEVAALAQAGIQASYAVGDAGRVASLAAALADIHGARGPADMILYNALTRVAPPPLETQTWESIVQQLDVNVGGAFNLLKMYLPACKKQDKGKLFFTGGGLSLQPVLELAGLGMSKAALRNLVGAAARSVQGSNVHVATLTINGIISPDDYRYNPALIAEQFWRLFEQPREAFETEVTY